MIIFHRLNNILKINKIFMYYKNNYLKNGSYKFKGGSHKLQILPKY